MKTTLLKMISVSGAFLARCPQLFWRRDGLALKLRSLPTILPAALVIAALQTPPQVSAQDLQVRTQYHAMVLHYNPQVRIGEDIASYQRTYGFRNVDLLCQDYISFLRKASGGQVNFSIAQKFELDEFPPDNDPDVDFTTDNYHELRSQGYDFWDRGKADYAAICNDPRFQIIPRVEAGEVDAIWIFAPENTGFWETAMAGRGAYWVNGGAYPKVDCSRKFVIYGFGWAPHQGVGFMLENTGHMSEVIMRDHIAVSWPASRRITGWNTLNLNNPGREPSVHNLNDWNYYTVSDAVHWDSRLIAPGHSQAGLSHFPPTACVNYGWSPVRIDFDVSWDLDNFQTYGGVWELQNGSYTASAGSGHKAILYGSHNLNDNLGDYRVPVVITDADIETGVSVSSSVPGAHAGILLRCSRYALGDDQLTGYYLGLNPNQSRLELARLNNTYEVVATAPMNVAVGKTYPLFLSLRGQVLQVSLGSSTTPTLTFTNLAGVDGAVGFATYNTDASFSHLHVTPVIRSFAEIWRTYPDLGSNARRLTPLEWAGDGRPYSDMDYWYAWWYEHLPKNPGTHELRNPSTGQVLGKALNSWWPYIFDINRFDSSFLPNVQVVSAPADTLSPHTPAGLRGIGLSRSLIQLKWNEPEDNIGVTRYEVYRDGQFVRETPMASFTDANLAANTSYSYSIKARDGSANVSGFSAPVTVRTLASDAGLLNPGFDAGLDTPQPWRSEAFKISAAFVWEETGTGHNGTRCISIDSGTDLNDARWIQDVTGLVPNGRYRLSGWIKGRNIVLENGASVGANLCAFGTWDHSERRLAGTFDWTRVELSVFADGAGKLTVGCRLGYWGNLAGGKAWFDDLALEYVPPFAPPAVAWGASLFNLTNLPAGLTNAIAVATGDSHVLALKSDGSVIAWGDKSSGQSVVPPGLRNVVHIAAGGAHSLAVKADGQLVAWGDNLYGQSEVPVNLMNALAASAGSRFSIALQSDGTVLAWGGNDWGETNVPPGLTNVVAIDAGHEFALALKSDGTVAAWGSFMGTDDNAYPAYVPEGLSNVVAIACGISHAAALRSDGTVVSWGDSHSGETNTPPALSQVIAIAAGGDHTLALKSDGTVIGWGGNQNGELDVPPGLKNAYAVSCGAYHAIALFGSTPPVFTARPNQLSYRSGEFQAAFPSRRGQAFFLLHKSSLADAGWTVVQGLVAKEDLSLLADQAAGEAEGFYLIRAPVSQ